MVGVRDVEQVYDVYRKYNVRIDYLHKLYSQGVPIIVPSTSSVPVNSQKDTGTRARVLTSKGAFKSLNKSP